MSFSGHRLIFGETQRLYLLHPEDQIAASLDIDVKEWRRTRTDVLERHGVWCDVEGVAVCHCGWTPVRRMFTSDDPVTDVIHTDHLYM